MSSVSVIPRFLEIELPPSKSAFLWGPRKTGKTTLLAQKFPQSFRVNLLETNTYLRLSKEPFQMRQEILVALDKGNLVQPIIIDEIQKVPLLLDEVHGLIEGKRLSFILCGSSARKLKRSHANMLGGRAWRFELFPLTTKELGKDFDLLRALNWGLVPSHYLEENARSAQAYIQDYLKEEIQQEGLVRNLPSFARFLDAISFSMGELVNYTNVARECGVDAKTVAEYYQILVDTLLGTFLEPFRKRRKRQIIVETPRFYLFDVGVAGALMERRIQTLKGPEFGRAFEHFLLMEMLAYRSYSERRERISFWRTKTGYEVDFVIGDGAIAIEAKGTAHSSSEDIKGLRAFMEEHKPKNAYLVCQETVPRLLENGITVLPWQEFLARLWAGELF